MVLGFGRSTDPSTATRRDDVSGSEPASFRYNNPGAQYPSVEAALFGQISFGIIGGDHKIARFTSPVNGAAANFDLLYRRYAGMAVGAAGTKWTGAYGFGVPGYDPDMMLTKAFLDDARSAIPFLKAIAHRESGRGNNLTEEQWRHAHRMFKAGSANAYLDGLPVEPRVEIRPGEKTGAGLLRRAREHIGEEYRNVLVPKDNANWKGPWDCAEFISWLVYQEAGLLYGCEDDSAPPSTADAYTGAWKTDLERLGKRVSVEEAAATVGGIVLRYPPGPGRMGHIALCDGTGGTVEAKGRRYGVIADTVQGRGWHTGILIPGIEYGPSGRIEVQPPALVYALGAPNMDAGVVAAIQKALIASGYAPGDVDGEFGPNTQAAVIAFQEAEGLVVDGEVGAETAAALGIALVPEKKPPAEANLSELIERLRQLEKRTADLSPTVLQDIFRRVLQADGAQRPSGDRTDLAASLGHLLPLIAALLQAASPGKPAAPHAPADALQPILDAIRDRLSKAAEPSAAKEPAAAPAEPAAPAADPWPAILAALQGRALNASTPPVLTTIDRIFGGEALAGKKTLIAILGFALQMVLQLGGVDSLAVGPGHAGGNILATLLGTFGGLGALSKVDRVIQLLAQLAALKAAPLPPPPK